jgi:hypothetical protein
MAGRSALAYCAWGFYRLKTGAWWVFLATILFWGVSSIWTFSTKNILDMYEAMQMPENSLEMLKQTGMLDLGSFWGFYMAAIFGVYFIYLLFIRKYFKETR